jgi:aryl-alcohol dehydrogenase-like predicted oxidoreductase
MRDGPRFTAPPGARAHTIGGCSAPAALNFGPLTGEADSVAIMDKALELGINFFDTANVYGGKTGEGITEQIVGRWLGQGGRRRERIVLATKVFGRMEAGPNDRGLSAYQIKRACDEGLRRRQTDHLDLFQMHHIDRDTPWEEIWQAMEQHVRQGKVLYIGSSNFAAWNIAQANGVAAQRHFRGLVSEQSIYNLNVRTIELEVIPVCAALGVALIPWSPLDHGLLGSVLGKVTEGRRAAPNVQKAAEKHRPQREAYDDFCRQMGARPADVAVARLPHNPVVTSPIIGPRTMEQLTGSLRALAITLTPETLAKLNEIWPGPRGAGAGGICLVSAPAAATPAEDRRAAQREQRNSHTSHPQYVLVLHGDSWPAVRTRRLNRPRSPVRA